MALAYRRFALLAAAILLLPAALFPLVTETARADARWADDVALTPFGGDAQADQSLRGPALVQFWASWCGSCGSLMWELDELTERFPAVPYLAVSIDAAPEAPRAYLAKHPLFERHPQRFHFDAGALLSSRLGIEAVPAIVLFDAGGAELLRLAGHVNSADLQRLRSLLAELDAESRLKPLLPCCAAPALPSGIGGARGGER